MAKNMNLKPKRKPSRHSFFSKNFIAIYIALGLVLIINQIVFSVVLKDRDKAKAFSSALGSVIMTNLGNSTINAGITDALLAAFWIPDPNFGNVICDWTLAGNPCITMADADGTASAGTGADDDGIQYVFNLDPTTVISNAIFKNADGVCTNNLSTPICIYIDSDLDCDATTGTQTYILGAGCGTPADLTPVGSSTYIWGHSEVVNANALYDYGASAAATETIWILSHKTDTVLSRGLGWNTNVSGNWQNDAFAAWQPIGAGNLNGEGYIDPTGMTYYDGAMAAIIDTDGDMKYADAPDTLMDADGTATAGIGTDDDALAVGAPLVPLKVADNVCINTLGLGGLIGPSTIIYVDGNADCVPGNGGVDSVIRNDVGGPLVYTGAFPDVYFNAARFLVYADADLNSAWTWGATSATTESLWLENQGHTVFSPDVDLLIEADGTGSLGAGIEDDVTFGLVRGTSVSYLSPTDNICISLVFIPFGGDFIQLAEDTYHDGSGDCIPGNGGVDTILLDATADGLNPLTVWGGTWSSLAGTAAYYDHLSPGGVPGADGAYTFGANSALTESIAATYWYSPFVHVNPSYTPVGDVVAFNFDAVGGDNLVDFSTSNGPSGFAVKYADSDSSGGLTANDTILEDDGNVATGPGGVPNGVIDRTSDRYQNSTIKNLGTLPPSSVTSLKLYADIGTIIPSNGQCDSPVGSVDDIYVGDFTYDAVNSQWVSNYSNISIPTFFKGCLAADISASAPNGTIIPSIPQLYDANTNGLYDVGDSGFFYYSQNDGPVGGSIDAPYVINVLAALRPGSGGSVAPSDTVAPTVPTNINISASASGNVNITWTDPLDADLSQILVEEYLGNSVSSNIVAKGVQILSLTGRQIGSEYKYSVRAMDTAGNYSPQILYSVTIPASGESIVTQPVYLPAPITPVVPITPGTGGLILQDPEPAQALPPSVQVGALVKMAGLSSVYFIDQDNRRHPFPNEATYFSWYSDFSGVQTIPAATLSAIPLGSNVTMRPGTYLIKIQTDPKVYAVEPYGVIRWVSSETIANKLYGSDWSKRIIDVNDAFFTNYQVGADITSAIHPTGSVISYAGESATYYIENGAKRYLTSSVFSGNRIRNEFVIRNAGADLIYTSGENYSLLPMETLMTLR